MRQPSTKSDLYAWWKASLLNKRMPRAEGDPQCGYYRRKVKRDGLEWFEGVEIFCRQEIDPETGELTEPEVLVAFNGSREWDPRDDWTFLRPITRAEFNRLRSPSAPIDQEPARPR